MSLIFGEYYLVVTYYHIGLHHTVSYHTALLWVGWRIVLGKIENVRGITRLSGGDFPMSVRLLRA